MKAAAMQKQASDTSFLQRHSAVAYFCLTFALSWAGALSVALPRVVRGVAISKTTGALMFPAMLVGPSVSGILLTQALHGKDGLKELLSRMRHVRVPARWYPTLLIPPLLILGVLWFLRIFEGRAFAPNRFYIGAAFGVVAGFFEEIGWMGFCLSPIAPRTFSHCFSRPTRSSVGSVASSGHQLSRTATPHGEYWLRYFLAFAAVMVPMRILIAWLYTNTESVLFCQLMHASSTASLVVLSPVNLGAAQEANWYFAYAGALWIMVAVVAAIYGRNLTCPARLN